jgi:hypothetical protein
MMLEESEHFLGVRCAKCGDSMALALKLSGALGSKPFRESSETTLMRCSRCLCIGVYPMADFEILVANRGAEPRPEGGAS